MSAFRHNHLSIGIILFAACTMPPARAQDTNPAMSASDRVAWDHFVRINQSANNGSNDTVWETWASDDETFPAAPVAGMPPVWPGNSHRPMALTRSRQLEMARRERARMGFNVSPRIIEGGTMEVRRNETAFDFIVANKLWYREGLTDALLNDRTIDFPVPAIEIKAVWKPIQVDEKNRYHWNTDSSGRLFGLTGLHISTKDIPNWHWSTFEHIDNPNLGVDLGCHDEFGAAQPNDCTSPLSQELRDLMAAGGLGPEWQNYRLAGTQVDFIDSTGRPTVLGNSKIEGGFMKTSSCITCHARAAMDVDGNFLSIFRPNTPTLEGYIGAPDPDWFYFPDGSRKLLQTDFVWAFEQARPLVRSRGAGRSLSPSASASAAAAGASDADFRATITNLSRNDPQQAFAVLAARQAQSLGGDDNAAVVTSFESLVSAKAHGDKPLELVEQRAWAGVDEFEIAERTPPTALVGGESGLYNSASRRFIDRLAQNERMYGGDVVDPLQYRDCVAITHEEELCSGTLIGVNVVLTARHCEAEEGWKVFVGLNAKRPDEGTVYEVVNSKRLSNADWSQYRWKDDVCLLFLDRDVTGVTPRAIATPELFESAEFVRAVGFGTTDTEGSVGEGKKRQGDLELVSALCDGPTDSTLFGCYAGREFVAARPGVDTCKGDSGGPVYVLDQHGNWLLAGVTSRNTEYQAMAPDLRTTQPCGQGGVYVRVDTYADDITQAIEAYAQDAATNRQP